MNKRIVSSLFVIALAAILVSGATMAWFTSEANITGNYFEAGTLTLELGEHPLLSDFVFLLLLHSQAYGCREKNILL